MPPRRGAGAPDPDRDRGQVAIEFVGTVPLILLLVAAVWECVLIGYAFSLAGNAADEAARAAAVGRSCEEAAGRHVGSAWNMTVTCSETGGIVTARVSLNLPILHPGLGIGVPIEGEAGSPKEEED
ncbi:TadE/TadG family type IV pilus assembly protein [Streptomyces sp. NPDC090085]|uniref:TadE/TadG family type IV pilus assembly protein n=1 Tax=unclassified Streptomyces TaxID=2593676 RepID=UPI00343AAC1C